MSHENGQAEESDGQDFILAKCSQDKGAQRYYETLGLPDESFFLLTHRIEEDQRRAHKLNKHRWSQNLRTYARLDPFRSEYPVKKPFSRQGQQKEWSQTHEDKMARGSRHQFRQIPSSMNLSHGTLIEYLGYRLGGQFDGDQYHSHPQAEQTHHFGPKTGRKHDIGHIGCQRMKQQIWKMESG